MKHLLIIIFLGCSLPAISQHYTETIKKYQSDYISHHEVVKGEDRKDIHFFEADSQYRILAYFEKKENMPWFSMPTSGKMMKIFRVYGTVRFTLHDTTVTLQLYQSQSLMNAPEYKEWLFLPFTDATTGSGSYYGGRYIDLKMDDIKDGRLEIDFNKAYNPYCAYVSNVYNCPIPPKENALPVSIMAGEKMFGQHK